MSEISVQILCDEVVSLARSQLGLSGSTLTKVSQRGRRVFPRRIRNQIKRLIDAQTMAENPKLMRQLDLAGLQKSHKEIVTYLTAIDPNARHRDLLWSIFGSLGISLFILGGVVIVALVQLGYL